MPYFFVVTGAEVDLRVFADSGTVALAAGLTLLAVVGKLVGGAAGAWGVGGPAHRLRGAAAVGIGMVPRGEVGLIIAGIGRARGVIPDDIFSAVVIMSVATTLLTPPLLKWLYRAWSGTLEPWIIVRSSTRPPTPTGVAA